MRRALRQSCRVRFDFRCGYYGVSESNIGAEMTVDHFQPRVHGGEEGADNLVYSCHTCNEFKCDYWKIEPDFHLLHPLLDNRALHYRRQDDGKRYAMTERVANHMNVLHLNRPELVAFRLEQSEIALLQRLNQKLRQQLLKAQQTTYRLDT